MTVTNVTHGGQPRGRKDITIGHTDVTVKFYRTNAPTIFAGFRQSWISGKDPESGATFELGSGAGWGTPYMTLEVRLPDGTVIDEYVDVTEFLQERVAQIVARGGAL